jgi:hypothetical protein
VCKWSVRFVTAGRAYVTARHSPLKAHRVPGQSGALFVTGGSRKNSMS